VATSVQLVTKVATYQSALKMYYSSKYQCDVVRNGSPSDKMALELSLVPSGSRRPHGINP